MRSAADLPQQAPDSDGARRKISFHYPEIAKHPHQAYVAQWIQKNSHE